MYEIGAKVVYGNSGVCEVIGYDAPKSRAIDPKEKYYTLRPLYQSGTIYCPMDHPNVFIRPIITRETAEKLIDLIPEIDAEPFESSGMQETTEHYRSIIGTHKCSDLIELIKSIYSKKRAVEAKKRKFSQLDSRYMKLAEDLLFGEFAVVLDIPKDSVKGYIKKRISAMEKEKKASAGAAPTAVPAT